MKAAVCFKYRAAYVSAVDTVKSGGTCSNHLRLWFSSFPIRLYDVVSESHIYYYPDTFLTFFWHFRHVCVVIANGLCLFDGVYVQTFLRTSCDHAASTKNY